MADCIDLPHPADAAVLSQAASYNDSLIGHIGVAGVPSTVVANAGVGRVQSCTIGILDPATSTHGLRWDVSMRHLQPCNTHSFKMLQCHQMRASGVIGRKDFG